MPPCFCQPKTGPLTLQKILGHESLETVNVYLHLGYPMPPDGLDPDRAFNLPGNGI